MGQSRTDHSITDVHVLLMVVVSSVNFGLRRPRRAVTFYGLRRLSRVIRILPVLPLLLAVVALFFFIIIPGDLRKETDGCDILKPKRPQVWFTSEQKIPQSVKNEDLSVKYTKPTLTSPFSPSDFLSRSRSLSLLFFFLLLELSRSSRLRSLSLLRSLSFSLSFFFSFLCL